MDLFESVFLPNRHMDFLRLARGTKGEMSADDFRSESFLMAIKIAERQNRALNFACPLDQDLILGALYNKFVRRLDRIYRTALRVDQQEEHEDGSSWFLQLPGSASLDPLIALVQKEEKLTVAKILQSSFSQASAYVVVFFNFDDDRERIASYFAIVKRTLKRRMNRADEVVRRQASLFDKKEKIRKSFMPRPGKICSPKLSISFEDRQSFFDF